MKRNRFTYFLLIILTIATGLASRKYAAHLPEILNLGLGDALWALMIYWMIGFLFVKKNSLKVFVICLAICFLVECSQLIQTHWLQTIRANKLGALILGQGFLWSDFVAYTLGAFMGVIIEYFTIRTTFIKLESDK